MRDIVEDFKGHLGGNVSVAQEVIIRRAAALASLAEAQEAAHVAGEKTLDVATYIPVVNALRRLIADLGLAPAMKDATPSLQSYLSALARPSTETDAPVEDIEDAPVLVSDPPDEEGEAQEDDDPENEGPEPPKPEYKPGDVIPLWSGACLIASDHRPVQWWVCRVESGHPNLLEMKPTEESARARASALREQGRL
ncbi:MAG: hypothetical protein AB7F74_05090 [Parvibaculaceae bacterium]